MNKILITGSAGLVGSEAVNFFVAKDYLVIGVDNDLRARFFGEQASTKKIASAFQEKYKNQYIHYNLDIRDKQGMEKIFRKFAPFDLIIHAAGQPSHDWAAQDPQTDFDINAGGTLCLLENYRKYSPQAVFIFTSTNKVYGDAPNMLPLLELEKRYDLEENHQFWGGIDENIGIDQGLHTFLGVSKASADLLVREYGKYFDLPTGVFRASCITGPAHQGAELHGFLAYLVKCVASEKKYRIFGYKGKQVRDNIHSYDLVNMFWHFYQNPRPGEVYNAGGSRESNVSVLEAIEKIERILNKKAVLEYQSQNRLGDHLWYITNISKFRSHYPDWNFKYTLDGILADLCRPYL